MERKLLIENIVEKEWQQFAQVKNQGGRASCQEDRTTFDIMRKSQFLAWDDALLESYSCDLDEAEAAGWNLLTEKYARMMVSTSPAEYEQLKDRLPYRSEKRLKRQEKLVDLQVEWLEETYRKYPRLAQAGRPVYTWEDTPWAASFETYQRGELSTYSDRTMELYTAMIERMKTLGQNLAEITLEFTVQFYGYSGLGAFK